MISIRSLLQKKFLTDFFMVAIKMCCLGPFLNDAFILFGSGCGVINSLHTGASWRLLSSSLTHPSLLNPRTCSRMCMIQSACVWLPKPNFTRSALHSICRDGLHWFRLEHHPAPQVRFPCLVRMRRRSCLLPHEALQLTHNSAHLCPGLQTSFSNRTVYLTTPRCIK